jgi:hypothetical protein
LLHDWLLCDWLLLLRYWLLLYRRLRNSIGDRSNVR